MRNNLDPDQALLIVRCDLGLQKLPLQDHLHQLKKNAHSQKDRKLVFQGEHSAILLTFIKLPLVIKISVLSIFEWPFYIGFTVYVIRKHVTVKS